MDEARVNSAVGQSGPTVTDLVAAADAGRFPRSSSCRLRFLAAAYAAPNALLRACDTHTALGVPPNNKELGVVCVGGCPVLR